MSVFPTPSSNYPAIPLPHLGKTAIKRIHRLRTKIAITLTLIVCAFMIVVISFYGYIAWTLGRPHPEQLHSNPLLAAGLNYENVSFPSTSSSTKLKGWYIPSKIPSTKTVIFSHSYAGNREEPWMPMYKISADLVMRNFNVLLFDYGYVNPANHRIFTGGVQESGELQGAIAYGKSRGATETIVWGFSMGAGTTLQVALHSHDISAMILDSTFLSTPETMFHNVSQKINLPRFPSIDLLRLIFPFVNGIGFNQIPYDKVMSTNFKVPIFFIHGERDERSPYEMIEQIAQNQTTNPESTIWLNPSAKHELIYDTSPDAYLQKTMAFVQEVSTQSREAMTASSFSSSIN